ncbi:MAG: hypothetical protein HON70_41525, partial [Lentisphaerae bacterium]|nr:hypothetical protein [Lentisphaerota bacterium]
YASVPREGTLYEDYTFTGQASIVSAIGEGDLVIGPGLDGSLDEIRIWRIARLGTDLLSATNRFNPIADPVNVDDLMGYWRFDDGGVHAEDLTRHLTDITDPEWQTALRLENGADMVEGISGLEDSDGDLLPDRWEYLHFTDLTQDGTADNDADGLTDYTEYLAGTDPNDTNTNDDVNGILDRDEDTDLDGLTHLEEQRYGTHPARSDTDDDGVLDGAEAIGDPNTADAVDGSPMYITSPVYSMAHYEPTANGSIYDFAYRRALDLGLVAAPEGVLVPESARFALDGAAWTAEAWVKPATGTATGAILSYQVTVDGTDMRTVMEIGLDAGVPYVTFGSAADGTPIAAGGADSSIPAFGVDQWRHVAGIWDPDNNALSLVVDGILFFSAQVFLEPFWGDGDLYIGGTGVAAGTGRLAAGLIDEVRVWNVARTLAEVEQARDGVVGVGTAGLLAYYRFDDGGANVEDFAFAYPDPDADEYDLEGLGTAVVTVTDLPLLSIDDADVDGLPDWWEVAARPQPDVIVDILPDSDADTDGLTALYEYYSGTNSTSADSDNDGTLDAQEDPDGDSLVNADEERLGSHPRLADTDDDGLTDGAELAAHSEPAAALSPPVYRAVSFDGGATSVVTLPLQSRFALPGWAVEAWIRPADMDGDTGTIIARSVGGGKLNYRLYVTDVNAAGGSSDLQLAAQFTDVLGNTVTATSGTQYLIDDGATWTHVAAVYGPRDNTLRLFISGTRVVPEAGNIGAAISSASPVTTGIGPASTVLGGGYDGLISEVRIWDWATVAAVLGPNSDDDFFSSFMQGTLIGNDLGLVAYYRLDDGQATVAPQGAQDFLLTRTNDWLTDWNSAAVLGTGTAFVTLDASTPALTSPVQDARTDTDGDSIADAWERVHFGDLVTAEAGGAVAGYTDTDNDGLNDLYEYLAGTDPNVRSDDHVFGDADNDGVQNFREQQYAIHPLDTDTDDDGVPDGDEVAQGNFQAMVGPTDSLRPLVNRALRIGAVDQYAMAQHWALANVGGQVGLSVWVKPEAADGTILHAVHWRTGETNMELVLDSGSVVFRYMAWDDTVREVTMVGTEIEPTDGWVHITARLISATTQKPNGEARFLVYRNGVEYTEGHDAYGDWHATPDTFLYLGDAPDAVVGVGNGGNSLLGLIDDVRVWGAPTGITDQAVRDARFIQSDLVGTVAAAMDMRMNYRFDDSFTAASATHIGPAGFEDFANPLAPDFWSTGNRDFVLQLYGATAEAVAQDSAADATYEVYSADTDADGLPDWWETIFFLDLAQAGVGTVDGYTDYDGDGLNDLYEFLGGLKPTSVDSDGNTVVDGDENPDGDGLLNDEEQTWSTDPLSADTDDDDLEDGVEVAQGTDPADGLSPLVNRTLEITGAGQFAQTLIGPEISGAVSIQAWINISDGAQDRYIVAKTSAADDSVDYALQVTAAEKLVFAYRTQTGTLQTVEMPEPTLPLGEWINVSVSLAQDAADGIVTLLVYVPSTGETFRHQDRRNGLLLGEPGSLYLGDIDGAGAAVGIVGQIDELRVWDSFRSDAQLAAVMAAPLSGAELTNVNLVGYWRFDDGEYTGVNLHPLPVGAEDMVHRVTAIATADANRDYVADLTDAQFAEPTQNSVLGDTYTYLDADTDADGIADFWELASFTDLTSAEALTDYDRDGLLDVTEFQIGTLPRQAEDTPDTTLAADPDGDGTSTEDEQFAGTNAGVAFSVVKASDPDAGGARDQDDNPVDVVWFDTDASNGINAGDVVRVFFTETVGSAVVEDFLLSNSHTFGLGAVATPNGTAVDISIGSDADIVSSDTITVGEGVQDVAGTHLEPSATDADNPVTLYDDLQPFLVQVTVRDENTVGIDQFDTVTVTFNEAMSPSDAGFGGTLDGADFVVNGAPALATVFGTLPEFIWNADGSVLTVVLGANPTLAENDRLAIGVGGSDLTDLAGNAGLAGITQRVTLTTNDYDITAIER